MAEETQTQESASAEAKADKPAFASSSAKASEDKKATADKPASAEAPAERPEEEVGKITHYFGKINVGVVEVGKGSLKVGDQIHIKGASADFEQAIDSLQVEHQNVQEVKQGESAGMKVAGKVHEGDIVYKIVS